MSTVQPTATSPTVAGVGNAAGSSNTSTAMAGLGADLNTFLTLLTTQLKNQDPENAMDTATMTTQLAQFASVEQQISMNGNLQTLIGLQQSSQLVASAPLVGHRAEVTSNQLALQNGSATLDLPAAGTAKYARIVVSNSAGTVVADQSATLGSSASTWQWNGRDLGGRRLPDGVYNFTVRGADSNGSAVPITASVIGTVTGTQQRNGSLTLSLGGLSVGFDKLQRIDPPTTN